MNRLSRNTSRYIPNERHEAQHAAFRLPLRRLFNKTAFELAVLGVVIIGGIHVMGTHAYFQISDVKVSGLDTYASGQARSVIDVYLSRSWPGLKGNSYLAVKPNKLGTEIGQRLAIDTINVKKVFPHTLLVEAGEVRMRARVIALNGEAYVSQEGLLVRWYSTTSTAPAIQNVPTVIVDKVISSHNILEPVIDKGVIDSVLHIQRAAPTISNSPLRRIHLYDEPFDKVEIEFDRGLVVAAKLSGNMDVQLRKAEVSAAKYLNAKQIDVRFADKVFVQF